MSFISGLLTHTLIHMESAYMKQILYNYDSFKRWESWIPHRKVLEITQLSPVLKGCFLDLLGSHKILICTQSSPSKKGSSHTVRTTVPSRMKSILKNLLWNEISILNTYHSLIPGSCLFSHPIILKSLTT